MNRTPGNARPASGREMPTGEPPPVQQETDTADRLRPMHPGADIGWSNSGGMVEQQASALDWVEAASRAAMEERPAAEMTDSRQTAQYSRWTCEPLAHAARPTHSDPT